MAKVSLFRSVLGSVAAVGALISSVNEGATMLNRSVQAASKRQAKNLLLDEATYESEALTRLALEESDRLLKVAAYRLKTPAHNTHYVAAHNRLQEILRPGSTQEEA